jgi:hypothetical protein
MSPLAAFLEGWRRVLTAPAVLFGTCVISWLLWQLVAMALSVPGSTVVAVNGYRGPWADWVRFGVESLASALALELAPFVRSGGLPRPLLASWLLWAGLWLFLSGGILDRYARARPTGTAAFFGACGIYFFRFLRLAAFVAVALYGLNGVNRESGPDSVRNMGVLAVIVLLFVLVDFAKARAVVEDRHSMIGAVLAAMRFIRQRAWRVAALVALNGLTMLALMMAVEWLAPATVAVGPWLATTLVLVPIVGRLSCLASEVAFFQGELAHAGYTAAPLPVWPDSPAVEAIENLRQQLRQ